MKKNLNQLNCNQFYFMNIQTAREILGLPYPRKKSRERNKTQPKYIIRPIVAPKSSQQRLRKLNQSLEKQRRPKQMPPIEKQTTQELIQGESNHSLTKKRQFHMHIGTTSKENPSQNLYRTTRKIQNDPYKQTDEKNQVDQPKISHTTHQIRLEKQQMNQKSKIVGRKGFHGFRRPTMAVKKQQRATSLQKMEEPIQQQYYISEVKKSVQEYMNNRQYSNLYLSHFIESMCVFEANVYLSLPKELSKTVELPIANDKMTLVFDLDETLLHSQAVNESSVPTPGDSSFIVDICTDNGDYSVNLKIRPHAVEVLKRLKQKFYLGIFTAGHQQYGSTVLRAIDPKNTIFSFRLFRQHCIEVNSRVNYVKDLRVIKNGDLSKIVLIDNSPNSYLFQKSNAVPIIPFFNDESDTQLLKLQRFLNSISDVTDVRPLLRDYFKLDQYHTYKNMFRLIRELY